MPPPNPPPLDPFPPLSRSAPTPPSRASYASILRGDSPIGEHDIERQGVLDDINEYHQPSASSSTAMPQDGHGHPAAGTGILATPSSGPSQGRSIAQGARNPPHQSLTPTASGPVPPTNMSPPTPSPTRAARAARRAGEAGAAPAEEAQDGVNGSGSGSGSAFTLEDMLGNVQPPNIFRAAGGRGTSSGPQRSWRSSMPAFGGNGAMAGEGLLRLVSDLHNARQRNTVSTDTAPARRYTARPIIPLNLSDSDESMTEGEDDAPAASDIRTRLSRRPRMGGAAGTGSGEGEGENLDEWLDARIFNESRLLDEMRTNPLGRERDTERPGAGAGAGDEGAHLHRGGNNRRREYLEWIDHIGDLRHSLPHPPTAPRSEGLQPTNTELATGSHAYLVSMAGTRRERSASSSSPRKRARPSSPAPAPNRASYISHSTLPPSTPLPSSFIPPLPKSHLTLTTHVSPSYGPAPLITFKGHHPTREDADATALLTAHPIPLAAGIHYYEAEVISQGEEGYMSVGWMVKGRNLRRLVGWTAGTWGWHGDDGMLFRGQGAGEPFSEGWGEGDTVGCGVDYIRKTAFFTKNGRLMGTKQLDLPSELHPAVGLRTVGESIAVNFSGPFKYDIDSRVRDVKEEVVREVKETKVENVVRVVDQLPPPTTGPIPEKVESMDIDLPPSPSHKGKSKATLTPPLGAPSLTPLDPTEKVSAAFIFDHLLHHGHNSAAVMLRQGLARQNRLPDLRPKEEGFVEKATKAPALGWLQEGRQPGLSDFPSTFSAAHFIASLIRTPFDHSLFGTFWRELLEKLGPRGLKGSKRESLEWRGVLWQFLFVTTSGGGVKDEGSAPSYVTYPNTYSDKSSDPDAAALSIGLKLSEVIKYDGLLPEEVEVVKEAFGALADPLAERWKSGDKWRAWRERFADDFISWVRLNSNSKEQSHLEAAIDQTGAVLTTLANNQGKTGAAFVNVGDVI
ncbi:hypothetical protein IAR50_006610 [Cryptococcus sp. DSM 104548]